VTDIKPAAMATTAHTTTADPEDLMLAFPLPLACVAAVALVLLFRPPAQSPQLICKCKAWLADI
jgi:hypothetical protein